MPTEKTAMTLEFNPPGKDDNAESKNYDIMYRKSDDKRSPVLIGSNGSLYIAKGVVDMKKVVRVRLQVIVETK